MPNLRFVASLFTQVASHDVENNVEASDNIVCKIRCKKKKLQFIAKVLTAGEGKSGLLGSRS